MNLPKDLPNDLPNDLPKDLPNGLPNGLPTANALPNANDLPNLRRPGLHDLPALDLGPSVCPKDPDVGPKDPDMCGNTAITDNMLSRIMLSDPNMPLPNNGPNVRNNGPNVSGPNVRNSGPNARREVRGQQLFPAHPEEGMNLDSTYSINWTNLEEVS